MANNEQEVIKTLRSRALQQVNLGKRRTNTFPVDFTDINPAFVGKVTVHQPTQLERIQMGIIKAQLLMGMQVDVATDNIAYIISTLEVVIDEKPDWLDIYDPDIDFDILFAIFDAYTEWVSSFRRPAEPSGDTEGNSEDTTSEV